MTGGNGTGAKMNVVVGTGGSIISFDLQDRGYGYNIGDVLTLSGIPFRTGIGTSAFKITVKNKYQSKFSGWTFGQLLELDDFIKEHLKEGDHTKRYFPNKELSIPLTSSILVGWFEQTIETKSGEQWFATFRDLTNEGQKLYYSMKKLHNNKEIRILTFNNI